MLNNQKMKYFLSLNEFTLLKTLLLVFSNKAVFLMPSEPIFGYFSEFFEQLSSWLKKRSNVKDVFEEFPESFRYWKIPAYSNRTDIFTKLEDQIQSRFEFALADQHLGAYSVPFKHETCKYMGEKFIWAFLIRDISNKYAADEATIITPNGELSFIYEKYYGEKSRPKIVTAHPFRPVVNFGILIMTLLFSLSWVFSRLRWRRFVRRSFILGADFTGGPRQVKMVKDIIGDPAQCMFVFRNTSQRLNNSVDISEFRQCVNGDGFISLSDLTSIFSIVFGDTLKLYLRLSQLSPEHFISSLKLPYKKAAYRALLNRYDFKYFWCRDDYNADHLLRSQELRRVGSRSLGINHGLPTPEIINPVWRYIDYDIYYVFGSHLYEKYYSETWSENMIVKPVGSLCMKKHHLQRLRNPRPNDIVYFVEPGFHEEKRHSAILEIAKSFPQKKVFVKVKPGRKNRVNYSLLKEIFDHGPKNIIESEEDSYELMFKVRYAISGVSTITAEAIQFGLNAFSLDFNDANSPYYYRDFPGLCVKSAAEVIERISAIDSGKETYPRESYGGLIDLSERYLIDVIRNDMGLSPTPPIPATSTLEQLDINSHQDFGTGTEGL
jgi:hypothetical protein